MISRIHGNFGLSILLKKTMYKVHSKIHWPDSAGCQFILKIKIGEIKKKIEPIKEYVVESVNFFKILKEKNNWK